MKLIYKGTEPAEWVEFRNTPGTDYESRACLRRALYMEQGGICAYCMKRLSDELAGGVSANKIEHIKARSKCTREERMQYRNMVLCCSGVEAGLPDSETHCDTHRGNDDISITPLSLKCIESLSYKTDGHIESSDEEWNRDIDVTLNLNHPVLVLNRKFAISGVIKILGTKRWTAREIRAMIKFYESRDKNGLYKEFAAAIVWKLNRWLAVKSA